MPMHMMMSPEPSMEMEPMMMQTPQPSLEPMPMPIVSVPMMTPEPEAEAEAEAEAEREQEGIMVEIPPIVQTVEPTPAMSVPESINNEQAGTATHPDHAHRPRNEGCVAIEHLRGYALQHPNHLRRHVLCYDNFCATPNHAIIVDDRYTSMKRLCANQWQCVESQKLVNNLKIAKNRRVQVSARIVVTPYDLRFPKAASWVAQIAEDVWYLIQNSTILGVTFAIAAFMASKSKIL